MKEIILQNIWFFVIAFLIGLVIGLILWAAGRQKVKNIQTDMDVLQKKYLSETEEKKRLAKKLEELDDVHHLHTTELNDLQARLRNKEDEIRRLNLQVHQTAPDENLKAELTEVRNENEQLREGLLKSNKQRKEVIAALKAYKEKVESSHFNESFDDKAFKGLAKKQISDLQEEKTALLRRMESLKAEINEQTEYSKKLQQENLKLDTKLRDLAAELTMLKTQSS